MTKDHAILAAGFICFMLGCLYEHVCEFDKYERVRLGEGRPRNNYPGGKV